MSSKPVSLVDRHAGEVDIDRLTAPFPATAIKRRQIGGGRMADYIDGTTVIRRLNDATGFNWTFTVDRYWTEGSVTLALVTLTLPGMGSRQHIGVQSADNRSGEDAAAKGAITDGLKKAATLFGVGLELYGPDHEAGEIDGRGAPQAPPRPAPAAPKATAPRATNARPGAAQGATGPATPMQRLHGHANGRNLRPDDVHALAVHWYGVSSRTELDPKQIAGFIAALDTTSGQALDDEQLAVELVKAYEAIDAQKTSAPPAEPLTFKGFWEWVKAEGLPFPADKLVTWLGEEIKHLTPQQAKELVEARRRDLAELAQQGQ